MKTKVFDKTTATALLKASTAAVEIRRAIHQDPELSGNEFKTAAKIFTFLSNLGIKPTYYLNKTAVVAKLTNGTGPTLCFRADTDALPILEKTSLPYASRNANCMHACGHDMHTAILCGTVQTLLCCKHIWRGTIVALFQPSEELSPGGALPLIKAGAIPKQTEAIYGLHVSSSHFAGQIGIASGFDYAGVCDFTVTIFGKGGHAATPESTIDPLVCASMIISQLQTIVSREHAPTDPCVVSVGSFHSGSGFNIIPEEAQFAGTIRSFSEKAMEHIMKRIKTVVTTTAHSFRARAEIEFKRGYPPLFNDPTLVHKAHAVLTPILGKKGIITRTTPTMYAEDFAYYTRIAKSLFVHLGVAHAGEKMVYGIHTPQFNPSEEAIQTGMQYFCAMAGAHSLGASQATQNSSRA